MAWETVIGLEIHTQLATRSKIFSGASTAFGAPPNTQASAVDLAMPGTLPVLNEEALRYAIMFGLAIDAPIHPLSVFERKNYFYPDLPKGYQTTQLAEPIVGPGKVEFTLADGTVKTVRIHHAHLEEDAGKSLHEDFHGSSGIDLNRAGTPLIEIVTEPDMRSPEEAVAFARKLHAIVTSLGICDGDMSQGSMRFDVNVSVRKVGETKFGTRTETKNLNSFKFMEEAIKLEVQRQIDVLEDGGKIVQETRLYDGDSKTARSMRSKEEANDYRYFPCPDLLPVAVSPEYIEAIRKNLPELPDARKTRLVEQYGLSDYDAGILSSDAASVRYFETCAVASGDAKLAANWMLGDLSARLNSDNIGIDKSPVSAEQLAGMITLIKGGKINSKQAKEVFIAMWDGEGSANEIIEKRGLTQVSNKDAIVSLIGQVIEASAGEVETYMTADEAKQKKIFNYLVGQVMKTSRGKANPNVVNEALKEQLDKDKS